MITVHPVMAAVGSLPLQRRIAELEGPSLAPKSGAAGIIICPDAGTEPAISARPRIGPSRVLNRMALLQEVLLMQHAGVYDRYGLTDRDAATRMWGLKKRTPPEVSLGRGRWVTSSDGATNRVRLSQNESAAAAAWWRFPWPSAGLHERHR